MILLFFAYKIKVIYLHTENKNKIFNNRRSPPLKQLIIMELLNHQNFIKELESEITGYDQSLKDEWEDNYQWFVQFVDTVDDHSKDLFNTSMAPTWELFLKQIDLVLDEMDKDPNLYGYIYINKDDSTLNAELVNNSEHIESLKEYADSTSNSRFFIDWD